MSTPDARTAGRRAASPIVTDDAAPPESGRLDAFISYRRLPEDVEFVDRLQGLLADRGKQVWVDRREIEPAADWSERIARGIDAAKALVFVISPGSVASPECRRELEAAELHHKLIVPLVLRDVDRHELPESLTRPNWIFFSSGHDTELALDQLVEALEADLDWRDAHTRLAVRTREWAGAVRDRSFLLRGTDLHAAEEWLGEGARHDKTPPTAIQTEYILASRRGADRTQRTWRAALSAGLAVALVLAGLAFVQRNQAQHEARVAESRALAAEAIADLSTDPQSSLQLALSSTKIEPSGPAEQALRLALAEARLRMVIRSGSGSSTVAAWNPERAQIAVTGAHDSIELWDTTTGRLDRTLVASRSAQTTQLLYDPSGARLAAVSAAGYVSMWALAPDGAATAISTAGLNGAIHADAISIPNAKPDIALAGVWDIQHDDEFDLYGPGLSNVVIFDAVTGSYGPLFNPGLTAGAEEVTPSPDGSQLLVDGDLIDFTTKQQKALSGLVDAAVPGPACWSANGSEFDTSTTVDAGGPIQLWNDRTVRSIGQMETPVGPTTALACSAGSSNEWVAGGDAAGNLILRLAGGAVVPLYGHSDAIDAIASSPDGRYLATASADGTARIFDAATGRSIAVLAGDGAPLKDVRFATGDGLVLTVDELGVVRVWDAGVGEPLTKLARAPRGTSVALGFADGGRQIYGVDVATSTGKDSEVTSAAIVLWSAGSGRILRAVALPGIAPAATACSSALDSVGRDAALEMIVGPRCAIPLPPRLDLAVPVPRPPADNAYGAVLELLALAVSPDGRHLAYAEAHAVVFGDMSGRRLATLEVRGSPTGVSFGAADELLVTTTKAVYLWRPLSGRSALAIAQGSAPIDAVLDASGTRLATANAAGVVEVWATSGGRHLGTFRPPHGAPTASYFDATPLRVALDAAGGVVASGNADGTVDLWSVATGKLVAARTVSAWPIIELDTSGDGARLLAVDWPQAGSGVNPSGAAEVLDSSSGRVVGAYRSPAPVEAPINPGAALSADGSFLFAGALGLAPSSPGGVEATYQLSSSQTMVDLQAATASGSGSYSLLAADPWAPDGSEVLAGDSVYVCSACGALGELQRAALSRIAWSHALSPGHNSPPSSNPYR